MPKRRVFVDGHVGTTGLRIRELLARREDLAVLTLGEEDRKSPEARQRAMREAEIAVLCLPDDAAREAVGWAAKAETRVVDASTAHRTAPSFVYGLPELAPEQRARIASARLVSNPGCYATGVVLLLRPLIEEGLLPADSAIAVHALSGYSGGGREMIARWEDPARGLLQLTFPALYALERVHKHVPEMTLHSGLRREPQFVPAVGPFRCGMRVEIPLAAGSLVAGATAKIAWEALHARYRGERFVRVLPFEDPFAGDEWSFDPRACNDTNRVEVRAVGNPAGHLFLAARLDNLGKGAAGAAVQNLNLMLGLPEERGLGD